MVKLARSTRFYSFLSVLRWLGNVVVGYGARLATGRGFDFQPPHCRAATLRKSFRHNFTQVPSPSEVTTVWRCINSISLKYNAISFKFNLD